MSNPPGDDLLKQHLFAGATQLRHGNPTAALTSYQAAHHAGPSSAQALCGLGKCHYFLGQHMAARDDFAAAIQCDKTNIDAACYYIVTLAKLGERRAARDEVTRLAPLVGGAIFLSGCLGVQTFEFGDWEAVLALTEVWEDAFPDSVAPLAVRSIALVNLRREADHKELVSPENFLSITGNFHCVPELAGYPRLNQELADAIQAAEKVDIHKGRKATKIGDQTVHLDPVTSPAVRIFYSGIAAAVEAYTRRVTAAAPDHPWIRKRPATFNIVSWGVLLRGKGFQNAHIHPSAWLSGVYYPHLPKGTIAEHPPAGWLQFGTALQSAAGNGFAVQQIVQPAEGTLALFPSYYWHATGPTEVSGRTSLAFDIGAPGKGHPLR